MTEKRFTKVSSEGYWKIKDSQADYKEIWDLTNPQLIEDRLNQLNDENKQLKQEIEELEFKLRTIESYDRTAKEEFSDTVYDFKKKLEKW